MSETGRRCASCDGSGWDYCQICPGPLSDELADDPEADHGEP